MPKPRQTSVESYLLAVRRQLKGLDPAEQREILRELADHLEDTTRYLRESGLSEEASTERAVAEMGDPTAVGQRLRREHLEKPLPLKLGLMAAVPIFAFLLYFELFPIAVYFLVPRGQNPASLIIATLAASLILILAICVWSWRRGRRFLIAPFAGIAIVYGLSRSWTSLAGPWAQSGLHALVASWVPVVSASRPNDPINSWLVLGPWVVVALAFLPTLAALTIWGRLAGSLTILGGTGILTAFTWIDSPMSWLKLLAYLALCVGIAVFVTAPRVRQMKVAWAVLVADWILVALGKWYFIVYEAPHAMNPQWRATRLPTLEGVWGEMPLAALVFSLALLLGVQLLTWIRGRRTELREAVLTDTRA
ncbi:MAG: permease prefix domain 1-containing protein [Chloroflexota bacterium]|jgi:uncharacterized membrane protein